MSIEFTAFKKEPGDAEIAALLERLEQLGWSVSATSVWVERTAKIKTEDGDRLTTFPCSRPAWTISPPAEGEIETETAVPIEVES